MFNIVVFTFWQPLKQIRYLLCLYMYCRWRSTYQEGRVGIPITGLTPPPFCACPKLGPGFQRHMSWFLFLCVCEGGRWLFVWLIMVELYTINHCLNVLFMVTKSLYGKIQRFDDLIWFLVFNATFSNISAISWRPVLVVEKAGVTDFFRGPGGSMS
jgi:hypothetical protein